MAPEILPRIITQHAEDAGFLWLLRDQSVHAPQFNLKDLAELDGRVEAHLDGLRIAGEPGWAICQEALALADAGEVFTCAILAFETGNEPRIQGILKKGAAVPKLARGVASALGWLPYEKAQKHIQALIAAESPNLRRIGIAAGAIHRQLPEVVLGEALLDPDPLVRARACRAAGELGRADCQTGVRKNLTAEQEDCRFWAHWALALSGDPTTVPMLLAEAAGKGRHRERAMHLGLRRLEVRLATVWQKSLADDPQQVRLAIQAAGVIGAPEAVPWLIELMNNPVLARLAAEAFTLITGADLDRDHLRGEKPEGFEVGPTETPEDENVEMDPDEHLPWPDSRAVQIWWDAHRKEFTPLTRYLLGKPIALDWLPHVLRTGRQRQRAAAALELALLQPRQPLFEVRAPGFRQQALLGGSAGRG
jgi:uncharacterized protein (TIGR02270 family)